MPELPHRVKTRLGITRLVLAGLVVVLLLGAAPCAALQVPTLSGRVNDNAGLLSPSTVRQLEAALAQIESTDSTQVVVLTIPSLEGDSLEDFSMRVVEKWRLGQKRLDNGVLLLVAKQDRKIRIEVGYGLEGKLTDLVAGRIIRNVIAPQFKAGHFDQGIVDGVQAIVSVVRGEFTSAQTPHGNVHNNGSPGLFGIVALLFFMNLLGRVNRPMGAAAGGLLAPLAGGLFFNLGWLGILGLIPAGLMAGFALSLLGRPLSFSHVASSRGSGTYRNGGPGGGFGGGFFGGGFGGFSGGGGFGGFSGGGGGFGGGGASGGW